MNAFTWVRLLGLAALLPLEVFWMTWRHDTQSLIGQDRWWANLLGEAHYLPALALTISLCAVVFGGDRLWAAIRDGWLARQQDFRPSGFLLVIHAVAFAIFHQLCTILLGPAEKSGWTGDLLFGLALVTGLIQVMSWVGCLAPWSAWFDLAKAMRGLIVVSLALAGLAFASSRLTEWLWSPLANVTMSWVETLLQFCLPEVLCEPSTRTIGSARFVVEIAPSCSGYEGLGLVGAVVSLFLIYRRDELIFPRVLIILPLALGLVWCANLVRIVTLILIGHAGWPDVAQGGFHSQAGWIIFNGVALGTVFATMNCRWLTHTKADQLATKSTNPAAVYLVPFMAVVGTALLTSAFVAEGLDRWYGVRVLVGLAALLAFWRPLQQALGAFPRTCQAMLEVVLVGVGVFALWIVLEYAGNGSPVTAAPQELAKWTALEKALWFAFRIFGAVLIVPVAEELAFRGYLYRRLQSSEFEQVALTQWFWLPAVISSVLFGVLHPDRAIAGTIAGLAYLGLTWRRGSIWEATLAHALTNALLAAYVLQTNSWKLW